MKKAISIGINNAKGLAPLKAAVSGAKEFNDWAYSQGYATTLFTDEDKPVKLNDIFEEIDQCVQSKKYSQLIIFFSGHGILKSPSQEAWILSNAISNPNESVNLTASIDYARTSGIPYIVFISDACRILPSELQLTGNGAVIFPISDDTNQDCAIDVYYATRPGNPANELSSNESVKKFGIFTQGLLEVLKGNYPELLWSKAASGLFLNTFYEIEQLQKNKKYKALPTGSVWELNSPSLEHPLKTIVKEKANAISFALNQHPDIRIQFQKDQPPLAKFDDNLAKELLLASGKKIHSHMQFESEVQQSIQKTISTGVNSTLEGSSSFKSILEDISPVSDKTTLEKPDSNLLKISERIFRSKGRVSFETQTGFTIVGSEIADVIVTDNGRDIFIENDNIHVRIHDHTPVFSALFILPDGQSIPVAVLKGFIGTLVFDEGRLLTVNYTPSRNTYAYRDYERHEQEIDFIRAFVASSASEGFDYQKTFEKEFDKDGSFRYSNSGSFLRREKDLDPSLGLYAAYAYRQAGQMKEIYSVYKYIRGAGNNTFLFDVAMLANKLRDKDILLAPFCPMLSLGWAYSANFMHQLPQVVQEASSYLIPNLWTTFSKQGTDLLVNAIQNNQLK